MNLLKRIFRAFRDLLGKSVEAVLQEVAAEARPIVSQLDELKGDPEKIATAYEQHGLAPIASQITGELVGFALLGLARKIVSQKFPAVPKHLIDTGIQLALSSIRNR